MAGFAFQDPDLNNKVPMLPKLSDLDILTIKDMTGKSVEMERCTSFPKDACCAFQDDAGHWYWLTNDILTEELEHRLKYQHGLVDFGNESIFKVDLIKAYDKPLYDHELDLLYEKVYWSEDDNLVFLLGDTSQGPLIWPDWAEFILLNWKNQTQWLPRTRHWLLTDSGIKFNSKAEEDSYINDLVTDGWLVKLPSAQ